MDHDKTASLFNALKDELLLVAYWQGRVAIDIKARGEPNANLMDRAAREREKCIDLIAEFESTLPPQSTPFKVVPVTAIPFCETTKIVIG